MSAFVLTTAWKYRVNFSLVISPLPRGWVWSKEETGRPTTRGTLILTWSARPMWGLTAETVTGRAWTFLKECDTAWKDPGGICVRTLIKTEQLLSNKGLLCSIRNHTQYLVVAYNGIQFAKILTHYACTSEITQYCESTIFHLKALFNKKRELLLKSSIYGLSVIIMIFLVLGRHLLNTTWI